ncbi:MAG: MerR family transcriptional regulator [Olsenella sp.]|jgi:DNA-binding transcriptional MerR regulator|nr:MerR family transcriptional regulator [Olsenella sp.]
MRDTQLAGRTYTIGELATMSGATERSLRHYEDLGLLSPARGGNGYRRYGEKDVERLQQVLLYRACGMGLSEIRALLESPDYSAEEALEQHLKTLRTRQRELETLVETVEKTIATMKGQETMTNEERFRGIKEQAIEKNESTYGAEARERYGDDAVDAANECMRAMSEKDWNEMRELEQGIIRQLKAAMSTGDPAGNAAQELVDLHRRWICGYWGEGRYSAQAHLALGEMYLADERFRDYYDSRAGAGATEFLVAALRAKLGDGEPGAE